VLERGRRRSLAWKRTLREYRSSLFDARREWRRATRILAKIPIEG